MKRLFKTAFLLLAILCIFSLFTACSSEEKKINMAAEKTGNIITPEEFTFTNEIQQLSHQALELPTDNIRPAS